MSIKEFDTPKGFSLVEDEEEMEGFSLVEDEEVEEEEMEGFSLVGEEEMIKEEVVEEEKEIEELETESFFIKDQATQLEKDFNTIRKFEDDYIEKDPLADPDKVDPSMPVPGAMFKVGKIETEIVPVLEDSFSKWGFTFVESGIGDYVTVKSTDPDKVGLTKEFSVGNSGVIDREGLAEMEEWMRLNKKDNAVFTDEIVDFTVEDMKDLRSDIGEDLEKQADKNVVLKNFNRKFYASKGLNYDEVEKLEEERDYTQRELNLLDKLDQSWFDIDKDIKRVGGVKTFDERDDAPVSMSPEEWKEARKDFPQYFNEDGSLKESRLGVKDRLDWMRNKVEKRSEELSGVLAWGDIKDVKRERDQMLTKAVAQSQKEVIVANEQLTTDYQQQTKTFEKITGTSYDNINEYIETYNEKQNQIDKKLKSITNDVGFDKIKDYKAKTDEEADQINSLIAESQALYQKEMAPVSGVLSNMQSLSARQAEINQKANDTRLVLNFGDIAKVKGEYVESAWEGLYNETIKGWKQGRINREFYRIAYGLTDIEDEEELARVSKEIALQNAYSAGYLSTEVYEEYINAGSVAEQWDLLKQNPLQIFSTLYASSMSQFASTGRDLIIPIIGGATVAGAGIGAGVGAVGGGGVGAIPGLLIGGGKGLRYGMSAWSAVTGFSMEVGAAYSTVMARNNVDMTNADAIVEALHDKDMMATAFELGIKRGVPIGIMNLVSGGVAKAFVNPLASPLKQLGTQILAKTVVDPVFEGLGELGAQVFSGEEIQMTEVVNEMIGGQFGNHSSIATNLITNTLITNESKNAIKLTNLDNMVKGNYSLDRVKSYVKRLRTANEKDSSKGITEEQGNKIIENAITNDAVNNLIKNKRNISSRIKKMIIGDTNQRQRLANLVKEKQLFEGDKELITDLQAEIDTILDTGVVPTDVRGENINELSTDYGKRIAKEMTAVNKVLRALGISDQLETIDVDNIDNIENNPEAKEVITTMMEETNKDNEARNVELAREGETPLPIYKNIKDYLAEGFANATHSITPKKLGKQFTLFSGKNMMAQMISDRKNRNRTGIKGFRHEALHFILDRVMGEEQVGKVAKALGKHMAEQAKLEGGAISPGAWNKVKRRLVKYRAKVKEGTYTEADFNQEVITTISDAINDGDLVFERQNKSFWQNIADMLTDFFKYKLGLKNEEIDYELLSTGKGAFEFLKNYNKSFIGGPTRFKEIKDVAGVKAEEKLIGRESIMDQVAEVNDIYDQYLTGSKTKMVVALEIAMTPGYIGITDDNGKTPDTWGNGTGMVNSIIKRKYNSLPTEDQKSTIQNNFEDIRSAMLYGDPRYGERNSVVGLVKEFEKERQEYGNVAAYINEFLSKRAIDIFTPIVSEAMGTELTAAKDVAIDEKRKVETPDQAAKPSLRKTLKIGDKSKFVKDIKAEVKKQILMNIGKINTDKFFKDIQKSFREYLTAPTVAEDGSKIPSPIKTLMGTVASEKYKQLLKDHGQAIYEKISQRLMNKRFEDFIVPVIDPKTGKQERMSTLESREDVRVKDEKAGNFVWTKKKFDQQEFEDYHLKPKKGRPSSKQNTLGEVLAEEIAFDATMEVMEDESVIEAMRAIVPGVDTKTLTAKVGREIERAPGMRFSETESGLTFTPIEKDAFIAVVDDLAKIINDNDANDIFIDGKLISSITDPYSAYPNIIKWVENLYNEGKLEDITTLKFKAAISNFPDLSPEAKQQYDKQGAFGNNEDAKKELAKHAPIIAKELGKLIIDIIGLDWLGFFNRALDSAEKSEKNIDSKTGKKGPAPYYETKLKLEKDLEKLSGKTKIPQYVLDILPNVRLMNKKYSLFQKIDKIQQLSDNVDERTDRQIKQLKNLGIKDADKKSKQDLLNDPKLVNEIEKANEANIILATYIAEVIGKLVAEGKISEVSAINIAQLQTNMVGGFRAWSRLVGIDVREHAQVVDETNPDYIKVLEIENQKFQNKANEIITKAKGEEVIFQIPMLVDDTGKVFKEKGKEVLIETTKEEWINWNAKKAALKALGSKGEHMKDNLATMIAMTKVWLRAKKLNTNKKGISAKALNYLNRELPKVFIGHNQVLTNLYFTRVMDKIEGYGTLGLGPNDPSGMGRLMYLLQVGGLKYIKSIGGDEALTAIAIEEKREKLGLRASLMDDNPESKKHNLNLLPEDLQPKEETNPDVLNALDNFDKALNIARDPNAPIKKIRVFDFDDTLARTKSNVLYTMPDGTKGKLTAEEFATRSTELENQGAKFDFSEFSKVVKGKKGPLFEVAKIIADKRGTDDVFVLTARPPDAAYAIHKFLKSIGLNIPIKNITGLADGSPTAKSQWIINKAAEGYNDFYFADDHTGNVKAVKEVLNQLDVKSKVQQAKMRFSADVDRQFNDIIENKTGIEWYKEFSPVKGQIIGSGKGRFKFFMPPSAEDFIGLLYATLGKGKIGDAQKAWYKKHLLDPYARAMESLANARIALISDFKALKEGLTNVPKNLRKEAFDGYTYENVIRVYIWNKQGMNIPGLSKQDLKEINDFMAKNPELQVFAEQLIKILKGDDYAKPETGWLAGTITTDLMNALNTTKRARFLQEWQDNVDLIFSEKNLNKLEAAFGSKYREALEDMLRRMKTGKNRATTAGRLENRLLDYLNNSVGAVMFFNMRSALLQAISAVNFLNWGDNNPLKAGIAFANQKQYWSDFMKLMNSDFLVDRRNGLKINISESEIADAAKTASNKTKGVISYILSKGFLPTKFMDSFAIASGGATFFRNRVNTYIKQGMTAKAAEAKAFEDFRELAEESQQSARPDRISQQQASGLGRVILAFANTPMQYTRMIKKASLDLIHGRGDWKSNVSKIAYYGFIQNVIFNAMQQAIFALAWDDEDDEEEKKKYYSVANSMSDSILRGLGIGGGIVSTLKNVILDLYERSEKARPEYEKSALKLLDFSPPLDIKLSKFRQAANNWEYNKWKPEAKSWSLDNPAYLSSALVVASLTNIPLDRLLMKMDNIESAIESEQDMWKRVAHILGWSDWNLKSTKEKAKEKKEKSDYKKSQRKRKKSKIKRKKRRVKIGAY
jgi:hypothetical protein